MNSYKYEERVIWGLAAGIAMALKKIGSQTIPILQEALKSDKSIIRWAAIEALIEFHDPKVIPVLEEALKNGDFGDGYVKTKLVEALGMIGDAKAIPALLDALKDANWQTEMAIIKALGVIGNAKAIPALIKTLKDEDEQVRSVAAKSLGKIGELTNLIPTVTQIAKALHQQKEWFYLETVDKHLIVLEIETNPVHDPLLPAHPTPLWQWIRRLPEHVKSTKD